MWRDEFKRCSGWIKAALEYSGGTHDVDDVEQMVAEGRLQFWPGKAAVVITEIITYPKKKALNFFLAGGDYDELREMEPYIAEFAKLNGCGRIMLHGRRGWDKTFLTKELGYKPEWWVVAKEI